MNARYVLSDKAKSDLEEIWWYVFQFAASDDRADAALRAIGRSLDLLAERPSMGRGRDWLLPGQLAHPAGGYLIVYRESATGIEVARISGADRDLKAEG
ncbi:MAG: type II toxin-antitoxin system RelE/ParE family toxin [Myxococcales bacterium]|nr:type II toxin-antitoxin system RelE/ParE family toxin [Myxococcales bacterium]